MAIRKNTKSSKAAAPRNRKKGDLDAQKKSTKKTPSAAKSPGKISLWFTSIQSRWQNPRLQAAVGVTIMVLAVYLGCALISGLFTGAHDYALVLEGFNQVIQPNQQPYHNWLGGAGAHLAFWVGRQALGLGALSIPVLMFYWSWPMITQKKPAAHGKTFRWGIFWTVMSPWFAGYLASILGCLLYTSDAADE